MSGIIWLASYPKSGNTWVRIFLNNYILDETEPVNINKLEKEIHACTRELFDRLTGVESSDLTPAEIDRIRPLMYRQWSAEASEILIVKVHDAWRCNSTGKPIFPAAATRTAVYIIRNPLDIVASLANHYSIDIDDAINTLANEQHGLAQSTEKLHRQLPQFIGSWHHHVTSWTESTNLPVCVLRYEDMVQNPSEAFGGLVNVVGLPLADERLDKAIRFSAFDQVKEQEMAVGFAEKLPDAPSFFRQGKAGGWQEELTPVQINAVCHNHGEVMKKFGYLDSNGNPVVA